jgi:hypothetical protein
MPIRAHADHGWATKRRHATARFRSPAHRIHLSTVWRHAAITRGRLPPRPWERSSSHVTSRPQWTCVSSCQGCRTSCHTPAGLTRAGERLVTPSGRPPSADLPAGAGRLGRGTAQGTRPLLAVTTAPVSARAVTAGTAPQGDTPQRQHGGQVMPPTTGMAWVRTVVSGFALGTALGCHELTSFRGAPDESIPQPPLPTEN